MASRIERNYAIDFYRFLFTCIIFILHFRPYGNFGGQNGQFNGGYLGVEFFFIVSGFLMMANLKSKISNESVEYTASDPVYAEKETWNFFAQRFMRLMPQYWFSLIVLLAVQYIVLPDFNLIESIQKGFPDLFAIQIFGFLRELISMCGM